MKLTYWVLGKRDTWYVICYDTSRIVATLGSKAGAVEHAEHLNGEPK